MLEVVSGERVKEEDSVVRGGGVAALGPDSRQ